MLKRFHEREEGFTLIELMVVVLIIGILIAIALPTFLGARQRAQDKAAQSSLRNSIAAAKVIFTDTDDYSGVSAATMKAAEPSLTFWDDPTVSAGPTEVSVLVSTSVGGTANDTVDLAALSDTGTCFGLEDVSNAGTTFGKGGATCNASTVAVTGGW